MTTAATSGMRVGVQATVLTGRTRRVGPLVVDRLRVGRHQVVAHPQARRPVTAPQMASRPVTAPHMANRPVIAQHMASQRETDRCVLSGPTAANERREVAGMTAVLGRTVAGVLTVAGAATGLELHALKARAGERRRARVALIPGASANRS